MPAVVANAPAKTILMGEHSVVYGMPAIAMPVFALKSKVIIQALPLSPRGLVLIKAPDIAIDAPLDKLPEEHPIPFAIKLVLDHFRLASSPACQITLTSPIPIGSGLGSSASTTVALLKAYASFLGHPLSNEIISDQAYELEKLTHGTPSGIDNTVIAHEMPIYFVRGKSPSILTAAEKMTFLIADSGITHQTSQAVSQVRNAWEANPVEYSYIFQQIGDIVIAAHEAINNGEPLYLGQLMNTNQFHLANMGLSVPELDVLIQAALEAGALGAKLTGAGLGGNMLALVDDLTEKHVEKALRQAGAVGVYRTHIGPIGSGSK